MTPRDIAAIVILIAFAAIIAFGFGLIAGTALERRRHPAPRKTAADMIGAAARRRATEDQARRVGA